MVVVPALLDERQRLPPLEPIQEEEELRVSLVQFQVVLLLGVVPVLLVEDKNG